MTAAHAEAELETAFAAYKRAVAAWRVASSARVRATHVDDCAERLVRARVVLYDLLTAGGWSAPEHVGAQLDRDRALVGLPEDLEQLLLAG